jgi:hypothetical protein
VCLAPSHFLLNDPFFIERKYFFHVAMSEKLFQSLEFKKSHPLARSGSFFAIKTQLSNPLRIPKRAAVVLVPAPGSKNLRLNRVPFSLQSHVSLHYEF